jgi:VWFA-related protein
MKTRSIAVCAVLVLVIAVGSATSVLAQSNRTVVISATDKDKAVTDLTAADVEIKENGKTREIVSVKKSTMPLRVAVLVADSGTGAYQESAVRFLVSILGKPDVEAEFKLVSIILQPETIVDYTSDTDALTAGLKKLGPRGKQTGGQLMEAVLETAKSVGRPGKRPAIIVLKTRQEGSSSLVAADVQDPLRKSGAVMYVVAPIGGLTGQAFNLSLVLGDGSAESGGRQLEVSAQNLVKTLELIADELMNQYEVVYKTDADAKPGEKLAVTTKRKGIKVNAQTRIPN